MFVKWDSNHRLPIPELRIIEGSAFIARVSVCHVGAPNFHDNCLVPVGPAQGEATDTMWKWKWNCGSCRLP